MSLYKFRKVRKPEFTERKYAPLVPAVDEKFHGSVNGKKASELEERFYRATTKESRIQWVRFETVYGAPSTGMYGAAELDFLIFAGSYYPVQIDGEWIHKDAGQRMQDWEKDQIILKELRDRSVSEISRVRGIYLKTQQDANQVVQQILAGRVYRPQ